MIGVTVFLRFPSEADAQAMLIAFGAGPAEGEEFQPYGTGEFNGARYDYVVVNGKGVIWKDDLPIPGYHVNILWRGAEDQIPDFGELRVYPETPECVFA